MDPFPGLNLISEELDNEHFVCVHNCPKSDLDILCISEVTMF